MRNKKVKVGKRMKVSSRFYGKAFPVFYPGVVLLAFLLLFLSTNQLPALLSIDTSYSGKYRANSGYQKTLADLPYVYQESMRKINMSLGIPIPEKIKTIVIFSDHLTHNGLRLRGKRKSILDKSGLVHYIYLDLEFLITGQATLLEEMTHELTHAVMADMMGIENYDSLPMWVKEGTAVHAADQGLARIKALLKRGVNLAFIGNEDENNDGNPISLEKYVENYLKIQFLLHNYGDKALHNFINKLISTGNVKRELSASFNGLTEEAMNIYARDFIARTLIANSRPLAARENLARGIRFFEQNEFLSARLALEEAINEGLDERDYCRAAYLLAECFIQERNTEGAYTILKRVRADSSQIPRDRLNFLNAYTQYAMGLSTEAYSGFKHVFENSSNSAVRESALYYIIRILSEMDNFEEARKITDLMKSLFPKSTYLPLACATLDSSTRR
ncbi:MAG: hypothetical protein HQM10_07910 [Candidatus Riflebacteria bacterium]|nr:hypothetical protein [Candidatus Riflebacteria bacterium]